jgi:hypothetical protein
MPWQFASSQPSLIEPYQVLGAAEQQLSSLSNRLSEMEWDRSPAVQLVPGYDSYLTGETVGGWLVDQGTVDLLGTDLLESPLSNKCIDLGGPRENNSIACELTTEIGKRYQLTYSATGNWLSGDTLNGVLLTADEYAEQLLLPVDPNASLLTSHWTTQTFSFVATSERTRLSIGTIGEDVRGAIVSDLNLIEVPDYLSRALDENPTLGFRSWSREHVSLAEFSWGEFWKLRKRLTMPLSMQRTSIPLERRMTILKTTLLVSCFLRKKVEKLSLLGTSRLKMSRLWLRS